MAVFLHLQEKREEIWEKMAEHNELGKLGEAMAREHLIKKGYVIRETNWRLGSLEIDIVAERGNRIVVVEVKTRTSDRIAQPTDAISYRKMRNLVRAGRAYLRSCGLPHELQFDVITVVGTSLAGMRLTHIEDAFTPQLRTYR